LALGVSMAPILALAQQTTLAEVIVTAQKRSENIKDVPSGISVVNQAALTDHNISGVEDLTRTVPSISFNAGGTGFGVGVGETNIEIRGVSSASGASTVGVYFNDVAVNVDNKNGVGAPMPMTFDLNRIEVLRGPQGTLFGAGSEGGTVRYIFNPAKLDVWSGELSAETSDTDHARGLNSQVTGVLNIPVIADKAAVRVDLGYNDQAGWIDNYTLDGDLRRKGVNDNQTRFFRVTATIKPNDNITLTPELTYQEIHSADSPVFYLQDTAYAAANSGSVPPPLPTDGLYRQHKEEPDQTRDSLVVPSLTANFDLGFADFTSVSSYYQRNYSRLIDGTTYDSFEIAVGFLGRPPTDRVLAALPSTDNQPVTYQTYSEEFRLTSHTPDPGALPLKWVIGGFYNDQKAKFSLIDTIPGFSNAFQSVYGYGINSPQSPISDPAVPNLYAKDQVYAEYGQFDTKQYAAFGQLSYDILPRLHASAGLRTTYAVSTSYSVESGFIAIGDFGPYSKTDHFFSATPKFSLTYDLDKDATVYASAGEGFRLGGELYTPLPQGPNNVCSTDYANLGMPNNPSNAYSSDDLWSYEVGTKGRALDNSLSFSTAAFYVNWSHLQQAILLPICGYFDTVNIGGAESYGVELELRYRVPAVRGLTLGFTGGATHAALTSSINPLAARAGQNILYTPRWTATASLDYSWPITAAVEGFVSWDYDWTGQSNGSYQTNNPNYLNPAYGVMNMTLGARLQRWEVAVFAKNLLDDHTIIQSPTINSLVEGYTVQPVTAGVRVSKAF
jgi:outer membrane receptor protein involved in Fe transport